MYTQVIYILVFLICLAVQIQLTEIVTIENGECLKDVELCLESHFRFWMQIDNPFYYSARFAFNHAFYSTAP